MAQLIKVTSSTDSSVLRRVPALFAATRGASHPDGTRGARLPVGAFVGVGGSVAMGVITGVDVGTLVGVGAGGGEGVGD